MDLMNVLVTSQYLRKIGGGGGSGEGYGKVQDVTTAEELDTILANATADDVGRGFLYLGETTETYKYECVYIIREG